jgi:hypothetical protein
MNSGRGPPHVDIQILRETNPNPRPLVLVLRK